MDNNLNRRCSVCGERKFAQRDVLWSELIMEWELSIQEAKYINRQQGFHCLNCQNNLRSIALADAVCASQDFDGSLIELWKTESASLLQILEINPAGGLTKYLSLIRGHRLVSYPEYDMCNLALESASFDLVIHSDTLEHVPDPIRGLSECRRILKPGGTCIFTIPIIVDRMSRRRDGLSPSYHGGRGVFSSDQIVHTEFGADFWKTVIEAGFRHCAIHAFEYPAALAVVARA